MAIVLVDTKVASGSTEVDGKIMQNIILEYQGLSTDTKPILKENNSGSTFLELDTVEVFKWHIDSWIKL